MTNDFSFRRVKGKVQLTTPYYWKPYKSPLVSRIDRATAERLLAELTAALAPEPTTTGAWQETPTCAGWWWSDFIKDWSRWNGVPKEHIAQTKLYGPWWGPLEGTDHPGDLRPAQPVT